jgi:integrase
MATVIKRGKAAKFWTALFRDHTGRRYCLSTKETDKRLALVVAQEWEKAAWQIRSKAQTQRVIDRLHEMMTGDRISRFSLREYAAAWLNLKKHETAKSSTLAFYRQSVEAMLAFLKVRCDMPLPELLRDDVIDYRAHLAETLHPRTANHHLQCLRMILRDAKHEGLIADDPSEGVRGVKTEQESVMRRAFTPQEVEKVLALCDPEWRSMVLFGLYLGPPRLMDIATLNWKAIDKQRWVVRIAPSKKGQMMIRPIVGPLQKHIQSSLEVPPDGGPIHPRACALVQKDGKSATLSNQFARILEAAGLRADHHKGSGRRRTLNELSFHSLRHTCVSWFKDAGGSQSEAMAFVGHASPEINQHYTHVNDESMRRVADRMPDVTGL